MILFLMKFKIFGTAILVILASGIVIYIKLSAGGPIIQMVNPAGIL